MKILIIEDEKSLLEDIKHYLTENGYNCDYSTTVKSALNKLAENKYTVALIDLDLPDGSGLEIISHIKNTFPEMGIIITTAANSLEDKLNGLKLGADDYLTKPIDTEKLFAILLKYIPKKVEVKKSPKKEIVKPATKTKPVVKGKPIDAIAKKATTKPSKVSKKAKKGKKDDDEDDDIEPEEEDDDSDVDVKDDYDKADDDDVVVDVDLDEAPVLDLEGGGIPLDDDDDDEIPEKRGRGRRKKNEGRSSGSETYIRNRPLHIDITKPLVKKPQAAQPKPFAQFG